LAQECGEPDAPDVVRQIVLLQMEVAEGETCIGIESEGDGRSDAPALLIHKIAARHALGMIDAIQTECSTLDLGDVLIYIQRSAEVVIRPDAGREFIEFFQTWSLAGKIDGATGGTAARIGGGGPFGHFHLLEIEWVPAVSTEITHTVHEQAVRRIEAAHVEHVAGGVRRAAALASLQRDAWHVAQRVAQCRRALFVHDGARYDRDRLGDVAQRHLILR